MTPAIFMLESDADDRLLTEEVMAELGMPLQLTFFHSSEELFHELKKEAPALLLVEDNSVPSNAMQVLRRMKSDPGLAEIPVVVLCEITDPSYAHACYTAGAATVIRKPLSMESTRNKIRLFFQYWLEVAII